MIDAELAAVADRFGVSRLQVQRDHLISHLVGYLSAHFRERVVFIGGTASPERIWSTVDSARTSS